MKKAVYLLVIMTMAFVGCTTEENSTISATGKSATGNVNNPLTKLNEGHANVINSNWPCGDGYVAVWTWQWPISGFRKWSTCTGFGYCPTFQAVLTLNCVKIKQAPSNPSLVASTTYNATTGKLSVTIEPISSTIMRFWVPSAAQFSPTHVPSDFNTVNLGPLALDPHTTLIDGNYPKNVSGSYFYYDIPYIYVP